MSETFWLDDVPAEEAGLSECGAHPSEWYPTGCTREKDHPGDHGYPNWSGRVISKFDVWQGIPMLMLEIRNSHGYSSASIRSRAQGEELLTFLRDEIEAWFPHG